MFRVCYAAFGACSCVVHSLANLVGSAPVLPTSSAWVGRAYFASFLVVQLLVDVAEGSFGIRKAFDQTVKRLELIYTGVEIYELVCFVRLGSQNVAIFWIEHFDSSTTINS